MATPIGTLVVEMQANTAKFRADMDRAVTDANKAGEGVKRNLKKGEEGAASITKGFKEVALTTRQLGGTLASTISPALGEAVGLFGSLGTAMARLPVAAGVAVAGLTAVVAAAIPIAKKASDVIDTLAQIRSAARTGDIGSLTAIMKQSAAEIDKVQVAAERAGNALPNLFRGEFAQAFQKIIANVRVEVERFSDSTQAAGQVAQEAGREFVKLLPDQTRVKIAEYAADVIKLRMGFNTLEAGIAENFNDLEEFTRLIERQRREAGQLGSALEEAAKATAAVAAVEIAGSILDPAAQTAALQANNAALQRQIELIRQATALTQKQLEEQGRTGRLGIIGRQQQAFPPEPGIEDVGRYEGMAAGIAVDAETLARARVAAKGYDSALADLRKTQILVGDASSNLAAQQNLILGQMQKLIADGVQPQDGALTSLTREYNDLQRAMDALKDQDLVDSLRQQTAELSMTSREVARYRAEMELSAGASDEMRQRVGDMAASLDDQRQAVAMVEEVTQAFSSGLVDLMINMEDFDPKEFLKGIAKMITAMAIAQLAAIALKAAIGSIFPGAPPPTFGGGGSSAEILRDLPPTASGGIVTSPQMRLVGEAGPEAIIPLSQLGGGEVNVSVEIINQTGTPVSQQTEQTTGPDGQRMLRVFLRKEVAGAIGDGSLDPVMSSAFGLKRKGVSR